MKTLLCLLPFLALSTFAAAPPPANDDFANRTALVSAGSISISDRNASATTQALEPTVAGDVVSRSVWYSWTAPFTGPVTVSTAGSSFDTLLGVFTGTALGALTSIAENDDSGTGAFTSKVNFNAVVGIPYVILVGGFNGAGGKIALAITVGSGPCTYGVTPMSKSFTSAAGTGTETISTQTGCSWSAMSNDSFIGITTTSTGTGSGSVSYSVAANTALTARTGTMTIAGATVTITQAAAPACTYALSPTSTNAPAIALTNSVAMTAGTGCAWNATPNGSWITIQSGASGTGNGSITYALAANTNSSNQRIGTITAAGQTFTITQAGLVTCTYSLSPPSGSGSFPSAGGTSNVVISTTAGCAWTASSPVVWLTFSTTNGTGNGTVGYTVAANTNTVSRSTTLTVAGLPFSITQSGAACSYSINPSSLNVSATNGQSTVTVAAGAGCTWTAVANISWLTITAGTGGTGSGSVVFTYAANLNTVTRAGTLTIAGQTFTVNQAAAACIYSIVPTAAHYIAAGGPGNISVTAGTGCAWTAVSNDGFVTVDSGSPGTANGTVGYTVTANATASSRTGTITVAGQTFTVTQDGTVPCTYSIAPTSASFTSLGGTNSIAVTANAGCTWSASSAATFLTFTPASGSGNGVVSYTVAANTSSLTRQGTITVAGQTFTVTQTGVACTYSIAPTTASFAAAGGNSTVAVTATQGCNWTSSSDSPWLVVTSGASGTGNGSVGYSVAAATNSVTRTGRLTIATKLLIVTQTGIACTYSIAPAGASFDLFGGIGTINITTSDTVCAWTATSGATWVTLFPASGSGNGTVSFNVASTSQSATRTTILTIAGQTFSITQTGDTNAPTVVLTAPANGSTISNIVTVSATATDNSSVSRVEFYRDAGILIGTVISSPYALPFQTTNVSNASHTFYAMGFDPANNQGFSGTNTVTISNTGVLSTNQWAQSFGGTGSDFGAVTAIDSSGSIIVSGNFSGTAVFGSFTLVSAGGRDIFLVKCTSGGSVIWAKRFGDTGDESVKSIVLDSSNNIFLAGTFAGSGDFGGGTPVVSVGLDSFVAKYSSLGIYGWSKTYGGLNDDTIRSIALDAGQTNIVITGSFIGTINFGGTNLVSQSGGTDTFFAKITTASGAHVWSKRFTNQSTDIGVGVAVDSSDNILLAGYFLFSIDLGGGNLQTAGLSDIYLGKFNSAGTYIWGKRYGGTNSDTVSAFTLDTGNLVVGGSFVKNTDLGTGLISGTGFDSDMYLAKYSGTDGSCTWVKPLLCTSSGSLNSIAIDTTNNIVSTGYFIGTSNFGGQSLTSVGGTQDIFVSKHSSANVLQWAKSFGGPSTDQGIGIAVDSTGFPVATGIFTGNAVFINGNLTSAGFADIFLTRLNP